MKFVLPSVELMNVSGDIMLIEQIGRVCYKSEERIKADTAIPFIRGVRTRGHEAVLEHVSATIRIICDRGVSHEIVRHRLASYCQESTRYVNYKGKSMEFVMPHWLLKYYGESLSLFEDLSLYDFGERYGTATCEYKFISMLFNAEKCYNELAKAGWSPQDSRAILPNALKTEIIMTANLREWRHFLKLRMESCAHPDMQIIAKKCFAKLSGDVRIATVFEDLENVK
jgi:thymidylate synthase (FAD)